MFELQPKLTWELNRIWSIFKGEFTNDEMLEYVQRLYMREGMAPMVENIETPCNTCIDIDSFNNETKELAK